MSDALAYLCVTAFTQGGRLRSLRYLKILGCDLRGADFRGCDLHSAVLDSCDLSRAKFDGCDLSMARLRYASLTETSLSDANLNLADMTAAKIDRTVLTSAQQLVDVLYAEREWPMGAFIMAAAIEAKKTDRSASPPPARQTLNENPELVRLILSRAPWNTRMDLVSFGGWL
jgi:hypothetical protein